MIVKTQKKTGLIQALAMVVKEQRSKLGLSQEQLAERATVDRAYISEIERGLRNVSLDVLERVAFGLNIHLSLLIHWAEHEAALQRDRGNQQKAVRARAKT